MRRLPCAIQRDNDGKTNGDLGRRHGDDEEDKNLRVVVGNSRGIEAKTGEGDERKVGCVELSSSDMKMMMMLRRKSTPANPIVKSKPLTMR